VPPRHLPRASRQSPRASRAAQLCCLLSLVLGVQLVALETATAAPTGVQQPDRKPRKPKKPKPVAQVPPPAPAPAPAAPIGPVLPGWTPQDSTSFNYPLAGTDKDRYRIRRKIRAAIKASPPGSTIRLTTFTFIDETMAKALVSAYKRGVSVQVLVNEKNSGVSSPFRSLKRGLKQKRRRTAPPAVARSFVRTCRGACRGAHGNLHSKLYLFSQVGNARWVSMISSANLTDFAAQGQWNHLDVLVGEAEYNQLITVFDQMKRDRKEPAIQFGTAKMQAWVFPRMGTNAHNDPIVQQLDGITCRAPSPAGVAGAGARTQIRIAMYAWFDQRGDYLAKTVRKKWKQGCSVKIIYAIMNGTSTRVLRDPSGRGAIPMRRSVTLDGSGAIVDYNHSKYVAVNGLYAHQAAKLVWTGSMNFTQLGVRSDDIVVRLAGDRVYNAYRTNFSRVWHSPSSRKP
jgi:hypothetical protein